MRYLTVMAVMLASVIMGGFTAVGDPGDLLQTFVNPSPALYPRFGEGVGALGENVLVGGSNPNGGAAYLFDSKTGNLLQDFHPPGPTGDDEDYFAAYVLGCDYGVLVSGHYDDTGAPNSGAVYLYDPVTGNLKHTFFNPSPGWYEHFGNKMAVIGGNKVLIGAPYANEAYLFDARTGDLLRTFTKPPASPGARFGIGVGAMGNNALISASGEEGSPNPGAAYMFDIATGNLLQEYHNPVPTGGNNFGDNIISVGSNVVVSACNEDSGGTNSGAAYLFNGTTE